MAAEFANDYDTIDPRLWAQESLINEVGEMLARVIDESPGGKPATLEQTAVMGDDTDSLRVIVSAFFDAGYTLNIQATRRE